MNGNGNIHIDVINVGFGQAIAAWPADEKTPVVVVDGGDDRPVRYGAPPYTRTLVQHLDEMGLGDVDLLVASHPHRDHVGGLDALAQSRRIARFASCYPAPGAVPQLSADEREENMAGALWRYALLWQRLRDMGTEIVEVGQTQVLGCGPFTLGLGCPQPALLEKAHSLYRQSYDDGTPEAVEALNGLLNAASLVVRLQVRGFGLLVPSDLPLTHWAGVPGQSMAADAMVAPHHGDSTCLNTGLMERVGAHTVVVSAATDGLYGLPSDDIETVLRGLGAAQALFTAGQPHTACAAGVRFTVGPGGQWSTALI